MTVPIYLAECAPVHLRGRLTVADNMAVTGGQFVAGVVDYAFSYVSHGWRCVCLSIQSNARLLTHDTLYILEARSVR